MLRGAQLIAVASADGATTAVEGASLPPDIQVQYVQLAPVADHTAAVQVRKKHTHRHTRTHKHAKTQTFQVSRTRIHKHTLFVSGLHSKCGSMQLLSETKQTLVLI